MSHSKQKKKPLYVPKPRDISITVKIIASKSPTQTTSSVATSDTDRELRVSRLADFSRRFKTIYGTTGEVSEGTDSSSSTRFVKFKITARKRYGKTSELFEEIRQHWCSKLCTSGNPYWLESCETVTNTFGKYKDRYYRPLQSLQPVTFSLGSFQNRGTFVKHWNTDVERDSIEDVLTADFESDVQTLIVSFDDSKEIAGQKGYRLEFEYRQFENYVVVDENTARGTVDVYFPLQWPPRIFQEKTTKEFLTQHENTSWNRRTSFLSCSRDTLGQCSVACFTFPIHSDPGLGNPPLDLINKMAELGYSVYFAAIKTKLPRGPTEVPDKPSFRGFRVAYALECLLSRGFKVRDRLSRVFYDILRQTGATNDYYHVLKSGKRDQVEDKPSEDRVCKALYRLISFVENDRFCQFEILLREMLFGSKRNMASVEFEKPKHYVYVPRIIVTPTQNYFVQPELVAENRVIRSYGHEHTLRIAFRDEDFSKLQMSSPTGLLDVLNERVVKFLTAGLFLCGRHFEFLACSNSQLRDHGAWLFAPDGKNTAADIRESLGELDKIRCVATYVSRMGQCFSSTKETVKVAIGEGSTVEYIEDVRKDYNGVLFKCCGKTLSGTYTFSDGIGKISKALSKKVSKNLGMKNEPSAYQIRYGGCKGMLAVDPTLPEGNTREILQLRESMKKFESSHASLEICEGSRPSLLYLNRQCVTLLSGLGVPDEVFIGLQDNMLRRLASMLLFETVAIETLRQNSIAGGLKVMALSKSGINVTCEPFFRSMLLAIYKSKLSDLLRRARIAIPESHGRLMMGVLDETKTLEYGQVFIRYSKNVSEAGRDLQTLTGHVMVSKNPCFHPGDMRRFDAIDVEALHHLSDVIVFPAKGPRPHTDEMSGSDLDGDKYFVTWYEDLDPLGNNEEAMDFTSPKKKLLDRPVAVSDMIQFVADYIKNDQLGIIANAHTVHADSQEEGIFSKACIKLAHMHSDAVDFPKTGECPLLPKELRPSEYPDFMMKSGKPRYLSKRVLGKLFRKCKSLQRYQRFSSEDKKRRVRVDEDLIVPNHEDYLEDALENRERYNGKLGALMALYGLQDEGEVVSGCLIRVNTRLSGKTDERFEVVQMIQASLSSLRSNTRHEFYEEFGGENAVLQEFETKEQYPKEILQKASAWYVATYGNIQRGPSDEQETGEDGDKEGGSDVNLVSFPWVADRILAHIKQAATEGRERLGTHKQHALRGVSELISEQLAYHFKGQKSNIKDDWKLRCTERDKLSPLLSDNMRTPTSLCGASLTGVCVGDRFPHPIQLYVHIKWNATELEQQLKLREIESKLLRTFPYERVEVCRRPSYIVFKKDDHNETQYYVTADSMEFLHSGYVSLHIQRCPFLLHLLLVVMHWGRKQRLAGSFKDCFLTPEKLAILFLSFAEAQEFITKIANGDLLTHCYYLLCDTKQSDDTWLSEILGTEDHDFSKGFANDVEPGYVLVKFFETYSNLPRENNLHITSIVDPVMTDYPLIPRLREDEVHRFSDASLHAYHEIAQCNGLDTILVAAEREQLKEMQETLTLPHSMEGALRFAEDFVSVMMSQLIGAQISIRRNKRSSGYIMEAVGNYLTLYKVNNVVEKLEKNLQLPVYDHTVAGASHVIFLDQAGPSDVVNFKRLKKGDFAVNLAVTLGIRRDAEDKAKFVAAFLKQVQLFKHQHIGYIHGSGHLQISVTFGSIYLENTNSFQRGPGALMFVTMATPTAVDVVERELGETADARYQQERNRNTRTRSSHKFIPYNSTVLRPNSADLELTEVETSAKYEVTFKRGRNDNLNVSYDANLKFSKVHIPPIKWLVVDAKSVRPSTSRSRDVDFRVAVSSARELPRESMMSSADYEKFVSKQVFSKLAANQLQVTPEFRKKVSSIRHEATQMYSLSGCSKDIRLLRTTVTRYDVSRSLVGVVQGNAPQQRVELHHCGFDGGNLTAVDIVAEQLWSAAKLVRNNVNP